MSYCFFKQQSLQNCSFDSASGGRSTGAARSLPPNSGGGTAVFAAPNTKP